MWECASTRPGDTGCVTPNPVLSLETLTTGAIPFLRMTAGGYIRLRDGSRCGLACDESVH